MAQREVQRRLAAIVSADVVGYTRLTEADEVGTVADKGIGEPMSIP